MTAAARSSRLGRSIALALILSSNLAAPAPAADDLYKQLAPLFVTAVHREGQLSAPSKGLSRWTAPVRIVFGGRARERWEPRIRAFLAELEDATGHSISMPGEAPLNVALLFADGFVSDSESPVYKTILRSALNSPVFLDAMADADRRREPCFWTMFRNDSGAIDSAFLMISERASPRLQNLCLYTYLVGLTGITAWSLDAAWIAQVMLDDGPGGGATLSKEGRRLLRLLYHPSLRVGMSVDESLPLLPALIGELP